MKSRFPRVQEDAGATIPEVLITSIVASVVLGGLLTGSMALQSSFSASDRLSRAQADLHRVADYMARDIRNAKSIDATASAPVVLTLTASDYFDLRGTPGNLADDVANQPSLGRYGADYGVDQVTVRYLKSGTKILREVKRVDATTSTPIADSVDNLTVSVDAEGTATITSNSAMQYGRRKAGTQSPVLSFTMASQRRNQPPQ